MLDAVDLIHMNGRIYDATLGRFLSADPFIQDPNNLQSYNRYSYVLNNPVSATDPSGFFFKKLWRGVKKNFKAIWRPVVTFVLAIYCLPCAYAFVAIDGYQNGGVRGAFAGVLSLAVTVGIGLEFGEGFQGWGTELARATTHGVAQGGIAESVGGDFTEGFLSAFTGSLGGSFFKSPIAKAKFPNLASDGPTGVAAQMITSAVVGGTAAELGGGKFSNGAQTGAMIYLFNHLHREGGALFDSDGNPPPKGAKLRPNFL